MNNNKLFNYDLIYNSDKKNYKLSCRDRYVSFVKGSIEDIIFHTERIISRFVKESSVYKQNTINLINFSQGDIDKFCQWCSQENAKRLKIRMSIAIGVSDEITFGTKNNESKEVINLVINNKVAINKLEQDAAKCKCCTVF